MLRLRRSPVIVVSLTVACLGLQAPAFPDEGPVVSNDLTPNPTAKVAEPADDVRHPGVTTEWWYVHFMDPKSKRQFIGAILGAPVTVAGGVMMFADGKDWLSTSKDIPVPVGGAPTWVFPDNKPGVRSSAASLDYDPGRKAYHLVMKGPYKADVWLDGDPLPGATGTIDLKNRGQWMGWTSPVATSRVHGWLQSPGGKKMRIDGWRGYHDHNWGDFTMVDQVADGWEWGVAHEPDGGASLVGGLMRRGSQWTGSVIDVRPGGTRVCSSSILDLSNWHKSSNYFEGATYSLPGTIKATCGPKEPYRFSKTFTLTDPTVIDAGVLALSGEARYRSVPGSFGMWEHIRSLVARAEQAGRSRTTQPNAQGFLMRALLGQVQKPGGRS